MGLEEIVLACKKTGDYTPTWDRLVNTRVFISVITADPEPNNGDFRFEIRKSPDGKMYIVVSDNLDDLRRSGAQAAIRENAYQLLNMIRPELGMIIALSGDENFYIPQGLVDWLRRNTQPVTTRNEG